MLIFGKTVSAFRSGPSLNESKRKKKAYSEKKKWQPVALLQVTGVRSPAAFSSFSRAPAAGSVSPHPPRPACNLRPNLTRLPESLPARAHPNLLFWWLVKTLSETAAMSAAAGTPPEGGGDRPWQSYHTAYTNAKAGMGALSLLAQYWGFSGVWHETYG
jgi:hypothetical protein